ncbi:hypothetical protein GFK32_18280, partial [Salmonella enterica subsp. enterica serovar Enteritidis]|nr:hypothetical protein [Salmonella enterica subsp. enterica serovar Enteritidis]
KSEHHNGNVSGLHHNGKGVSLCITKASP